MEGEGPGCVLQKDMVTSKSHLRVEAEIFYLSHHEAMQETSSGTYCQV